MWKESKHHYIVTETPLRCLCYFSKITNNSVTKRVSEFDEESICDDIYELREHDCNSELDDERVKEDFKLDQN